MELSTTYFEKPGGEENTVKTFALAKARADALGIKTFVVASDHRGYRRKSHGRFERI